MKIKHLLTLAALAAGSMGAWAQTDVTSTYLVNPSFELKAEGTASTAAALSKTGGTYYGWNLPVLANDYSNVSIGSSAACDGNGYGIPSSASDGDFYFFNRRGWNTTSAELSQTATLPAGKYFITVDYKAYEKGGTTGTIGFKAGDTELLTTKPYYSTGNSTTGTFAKTDPWKTIGAWFTVETEGDVKIAITEKLVGNSARADLYLDNVRLYKWSLDDDANVAAATPETPLDVTAKYVTNPYFDDNVNGWTTTTGYQNKGRATNQGGAMSGGFHENWNGSAKTSGKVSYTATGLPSGTYRVTAAVVSNSASTGLYLFAGTSQTPATVNGAAFYSVEATTKTGSLEFGLELGEGNTSNWIGIDNVRLELLEAINEIDLTLWNEAKTAAETALTDNADEALAAAERATVNEKKGAADPTTIDELTAAVDALNAAVSAFTSAYTADKLAADKADYVSGYNTMKAKYTESVAATFSGDCGSASGQHWSGDGRSYSDTWSGSAVTNTNKCTITLPAGEYALVAAGRGQAGTTPFISVKVGEEDATVYNYTAKSDVGLGIATDGSVSYDWRNDTFANNNLGRGWEWGYIEFALAEETEVTLSYGYTLINGSWASITDAALLCTAETKDDAALAALAQEIMDLVNGTEIPTTNIGEDAFQYSQDAIDLVQDQKDMYAEATASDLVAMAKYQFGEGAAAFLEAFKEGVQGDIEAMNTLNMPAAGQKFNVVLTYNGWGWDNKAMTYIANGRTDMGNYNIQYLAEANGNYAQAFTMTWVEGNKYKMSQIDADGVERFICTGLAYSGGNATQIRTTTDAEKALVVEVRATATEGKYNLWNTEANNYIGSQDAGVFTVNSHIDFKIVEAAQIPGASISAAGYATYVAPIDVAIPEGVEAYTVDAASDSGLLKLTPIEGTIAANTPVVLEGNETKVATGVYATKNPTSNTVTSGLLTGVYTKTAAPVGSYILQNNEVEGQKKVGFYKVAAEGLTVGANRAYLTKPASEVKAFFFDQETAIKAIDALTSGKAEIYDLNGRKLNKMQKGINIVNGVKVLVK